LEDGGLLNREPLDARVVWVGREASACGVVAELERACWLVHAPH
jgi:hypothetical protein